MNRNSQHVIRNIPQLVDKHHHTKSSRIINIPLRSNNVRQTTNNSTRHLSHTTPVLKVMDNLMVAQATKRHATTNRTTTTKTNLKHSITRHQKRHHIRANNVINLMVRTLAMDNNIKRRLINNNRASNMNIRILFKRVYNIPNFAHRINTNQARVSIRNRLNSIVRVRHITLIITVQIITIIISPIPIQRTTTARQVNNQRHPIMDQRAINSSRTMIFLTTMLSQTNMNTQHNIMRQHRATGMSNSFMVNLNRQHIHRNEGTVSPISRNIMINVHLHLNRTTTSHHRVNSQTNGMTAVTKIITNQHIR